MKKILSISLLTSLVGCATPHAELSTQPNVDLKKYAGTWYEQARLPNRFQKDCAGDVQADYVLNSDNTISVTNQCRTDDGSIDVAEGEGRLAQAVDPQDPAKLEVRFAPEWTSWLPMVWGDYWIMKLEGDYRHSLVGTPDREYLWVLSRDKRADKETVNQLLDYARTHGFDTDAVVTTVD